jgi:class 3 adenylate cyclase/tetratricopeptide (TPR) repeat protein
MDLAGWLRSLGLEQYEAAFRENAIDDTVLPNLTAEDLKDLGVGIVGHRRKLLMAIGALRTDTSAKAPQPDAASPTDATVKDSAERRQVTVMFADLVGSTALSARLDPEDMREIIGSYHRCCAEQITKAGGFVAKYMGDGVLAYFGYPQAHEDDAESAVRAGLELIEAVRTLRAGHDATLQVRVGIATGLVVVGDLIGQGAAQEQGVVGETPNVAARLQGIAEPNMVVIAESTRRLLGSLFELQDLGARDLKGIAGPVRGWAALRASSVASRFEALHASGLTDLVGREEECELMLRRWSRAKIGEGQVVLLSGEPGIGKSRLTAALLERLAPEPHTRLRYFCSPHHTDSALFPIIGQMQRAAGLALDDPPRTRLDKLDALLAQTSTSIEDAALIAEMLSLPNDGRYPTLDLAPQVRRQRTLAALVWQLEALTRSSPVLTIFEDAHWTDPTSLELFSRTVDRLRTLRALLIVTFRPEFDPPWVGRPYVTALTINRLAEREVSVMIDRLVGNNPIPTGIRQDIIERTDGIPLFIEEMTKAVLEAEGQHAAERAVAAAPSPALAVPASLHASLMARLDQLGPAKEVAQIGAAIGREFPHALPAAAVRKPDPELASALDRLIGAGLLFRQGVPPFATYLFKHALVQDAAYGTLLREWRRALHIRIAETLEGQFAEIAETQPELLARHWAEAGSTMKAIELWTLAGERASARAANREASGFFARALAVLGRLDRTSEVLVRIIDLHMSQYNARYKFGELHGARTNLVEAERLAAGLNDSTRLGRVLFQQCYHLAAIGDVTGAIKAGERAVAITDCGEDLYGRVSSRTMLARALYAKGWYREVIGHLRPVIEVLGEDISRGDIGWGMNRTFMARVWLLLCCAELGQFAEAAALADVAGRLSAQVERGREHEGSVWLRVAVGRLAVLQRNYAKAVETLEPALPPCESEFAIYFSRVASALGVAHARLGLVARGVALLRQAVSRDQAIDFYFGFGLLLAQLGEVLLLADDTDGALDTGTRALKAARSSGEESSEAWALWLLGDVAARLHPSEAAAHYREALAISDRLGMAPLRVRCLESMARLV